MGLDSVELLMDIEDYFRIEIPDLEAQSISTVQNMVDKVAEHLNIQQFDSPLRVTIFTSIAKVLNGQQGNNLTLNDKISFYLDADRKELWTKLESFMSLTLPRPDNFNPNGNKLSDQFKKLAHWTPNYNWHLITVGAFVDAICACNYQKLVDKDNIKSKYEILVAVMGITVDKVGVDYFEISPEKSFTSDLGID